MAQVSQQREWLYRKEEVFARFERMTASDRARCLVIALRIVRNANEADELLSEAITQTLEGRRKWVRDVSLEAHIHMSVKGIRSNSIRSKVKSGKKNALIWTTINEIGETLLKLGGVGTNERDLPSPDELLDAVRYVDRLEPLESEIVVCWIKGDGEKQIRDQFGLSRRQYRNHLNAIRQKCLDREESDGE